MAYMECETCGNTYDKTFKVRVGDSEHTFDCFECAIQKMAPTCAHCNTRIIGHGVEEEGLIYCCAHCARHEGSTGLKDRASERDRTHEETHLV